MKIIEVTNKKTEKEFLDLPRRIYKGDPNWVCPLDEEIKGIFDPAKNQAFKNGKAIRWVVQDKNQTIGRVAAFINEKKAYTYKQPTGGLGFFECTDKQEVAFALFDQGKKWLAEQGIEAMDAPINFGENDMHWGLLVHGYMQQGFGMPYHKPYYKNFFEKYGFQLYFRQLSYHLPIDQLNLNQTLPQRFWKIAEWVANKPDIHFKHFEFKDVDKFSRDFIEIYNSTWKDFREDFAPMKIGEVKRMIKSMKLILDEEFIWFVYHKDQPAAIFMMIPDLNQILKHLNGKMHLWNKIRFWIMQRNKTITRARVLVMGVVPKFHRSGIEAGIFWHLKKVFEKRPHFEELELSWVGDFNPKMRKLFENVGGKLTKQHNTYRYLFDSQATFQRAPILYETGIDPKSFQKFEQE